MAQHPSYWSIGSEQGLPSLKVYDLMEDSLGVVWAGTSEGLVHYDGLSLNTLRFEGARSQDRTNLQLGPDGQVWSTNFSGEVFLADYEQMQPFSRLQDLVTEKIVAVERARDSLYFMTKNEIVKTDLNGENGGVLRKAKVDEKFYGLASNRFLITSWDFINLKTGEMISTDGVPPSNLSSGFDEYFRYYYAIGKVEKLGKSDSEILVEGLQRQPGVTPLITGVRSTSAGTWVMTYDGVYLIEKQQWLFPSIPISDLIETQDGAHWFSSVTDGIHVVPDLELLRYGKEPDGLPSKRFNRIAQLPNKNIVATDNNGMAVLLHPQKGLLASFKSDLARESEALQVDTANDRVLTAFGDLYLLDSKSMALLARREGNIKSIAISKQKLAVVQGPELYRVPYDGKTLGVSEPEARVNKRVFQALIDHSGNEWLLTETGLLLNFNQVLVNGERNFKPSLACLGPIGLAFFSDRKDSIAWFENAQFSAWIEIPSFLQQGAQVKSLFATQNRLLVLVSNALLTLDLRSKEWKRFGASLGLPATDLKDVVASEERAWLATFNGIYSIPLDGSKPQIPPKVQLCSFRVNGNLRDISGELKFTHDEKDIEVVLRGISPKSRGNIQFFYKLGGLMDDFEVNPNGAVLRFRALAPGTYDLEVFAKDVDGLKSTEHQNLQFSIEKPWYLSWLFIALMSLALIGTVSTIFLFRIRYINQRSAQQLEHSRLMEDLRASQMTALRAQMNPHFMFNVLNSIQGLFTIGKTEKANEVLSRFSDLMRSILDVSDQNTIGLEKELEMIGLYLELEAVRFGDEFHYKVDVVDDIDPKKVEVPSLLIQPYVENAVKHGLLHRKGDKNLSVSLALIDHGTMLEVRIDDNGIGRDKAGELRSEKHRSFATQASSSRLDLLNVENAHKIGVEIIDKTDEAGNANGTLVILRIPLTAKVS